MIYRPIGHTGMSASVIGLGAEHLDGKPYEQVEEVIQAALENEINIIDCFMPGDEVRGNIAKALQGRRKDVLIQGHIGSVAMQNQYDRTRDVAMCRQYFEGYLRSFKTDYIDLGMMFFIDTEEDFRGTFETGFITYVQQLKREGKIRTIGFSSHNPEMAMRVVNTGVVDLLMFSVNLAYDMMPADYDVLLTFEEGFQKDKFDGIAPKRKALYDLCEQKNIAITTMKTLGAGRLLNPDFTPFDKPMTVAQCIHYALTRPAVVSALIGCQTREQVAETVRYLTLSDEERDYTGVIDSFKNTFGGRCFYCNHCLPCSQSINIASLTKYLDIASLKPTQIPLSIREHYMGMEAKGGDCIECGQCEARCPFGVPIIENMRKAHSLFGA